LRRLIFPSVRPLNQGKMIAARAAASSFVRPRANDATNWRERARSRMTTQWRLRQRRWPL